MEDCDLSDMAAIIAEQEAEERLEKPMTRYFRHKEGFSGITKILEFTSNGEAKGYDKKGESTGSFTGIYNLNYALNRVKEGVWIETDKQGRPIKKE